MERFARLRQNRIDILTFPADVVALVLAHLSRRDVLHLVAAYVGFDPNPAQLCLIPHPFRKKWIEIVMQQNFENRLFHIGYTASYLTRDASSVIALANWSRFSNEMPVPLAEYAWHSCLEPPHFCVHGERIHHELAKCVTRETCALRVTLHFVSPHGLLTPFPFYTEVFYAIPYYLYFMDGRDF